MMDFLRSNTFLFILLGWILVWSLAGFISMGSDKKKAKKQGVRRTPEATLMTIAALGGAPGSFIGMQTFRHKTQHPKFTIGVPLLLALWVAILVLALLLRFGLIG